MKRERERERGVRDGREKKGEWGGGWVGRREKESTGAREGGREQKDLGRETEKRERGRWRGKVLEKQTLYSYIKVKENYIILMYRTASDFML